MMPWAPLTQAALSGLSQPLDVFVRNDDAGWHDERLLPLLNLFERAGLLLDLAAIPLALGEPLARELARRMDAGARLGVHMHGLSHTNHESAGRQCEFGPSRSPGQQRQDLREGWRTLCDRLGGRVDRIFTPPWNRCAPTTPALLAEQGFAALSREQRAPASDALPCIDIGLDWSRVWREGGAHALDAAWANAVNRSAGAGRPLGLMLHHAVMDEPQLDALCGWLASLGRHPALRWRCMRALLPAVGGKADGDGVAGSGPFTVV